MSVASPGRGTPSRGTGSSAVGPPCVAGGPALSSKAEVASKLVQAKLREFFWEFLSLPETERLIEQAATCGAEGRGFSPIFEPTYGNDLYGVHKPQALPTQASSSAAAHVGNATTGGSASSSSSSSAISVGNGGGSATSHQHPSGSSASIHAGSSPHSNADNNVLSGTSAASSSSSTGPLATGGPPAIAGSGPLSNHFGDPAGSSAEKFGTLSNNNHNGANNCWANSSSSSGNIANNSYGQSISESPPGSPKSRAGFMRIFIFFLAFQSKRTVEFLDMYARCVLCTF